MPVLILLLHLLFFRLVLGRSSLSQLPNVVDLQHDHHRQKQHRPIRLLVCHILVLAFWPLDNTSVDAIGMTGTKNSRRYCASLSMPRHGEESMIAFGGSSSRINQALYLSERFERHPLCSKNHCTVCLDPAFRIVGLCN